MKLLPAFKEFYANIVYAHVKKCYKTKILFTLLCCTIIGLSNHVAAVHCK